MLNIGMKWSDVIHEVVIAPTQSVQWDSRNDKKWHGSFWVGDRQIEILFSRLSRGWTSSWRIDFRKATYKPVRGTIGETTGIMNAVVGAIKEFLERVKPDHLEMSPTNTPREKLYRAIIKRMMPQIEQTYSVDEVSYGTLFGEFVLSRREDEDQV
jgi:hypothetical protein